MFLNCISESIVCLLQPAVSLILSRLSRICSRLRLSDDFMTRLSLSLSLSLVFWFAVCSVLHLRVFFALACRLCELCSRNTLAAASWLCFFAENDLPKIDEHSFELSIWPFCEFEIYEMMIFIWGFLVCFRLICLLWLFCLLRLIDFLCDAFLMLSVCRVLAFYASRFQCLVWTTF